MDASIIKKLLAETRVLRRPRKLLSTFGATRIEYHLVSSIDELPNKTRLREGWVVSEKPKILTPETIRERFEGFGPDSQEFAEWLSGQYRDLLRALEYNFKNTDLKTTVLSQSPAAAADRIQGDIDARSVSQAALIACPDAVWSLALMRLTLDSAAQAFPTHVRDLDAHGQFDPGSNEARRRENEIERLFDAARQGAAARERLGAKLREYGLFERYEDRFLSLFAR